LSGGQSAGHGHSEELTLIACCSQNQSLRQSHYIITHLCNSQVKHTNMCTYACPHTHSHTQKTHTHTHTHRYTISIYGGAVSLCECRLPLVYYMPTCTFLLTNRKYFLSGFIYSFSVLEF